MLNTAPRIIWTIVGATSIGLVVSVMNGDDKNRYAISAVIKSVIPDQIGKAVSYFT